MGVWEWEQSLFQLVLSLAHCITSRFPGSLYRAESRTITHNHAQSRFKKHPSPDIPQSSRIAKVAQIVNLLYRRNSIRQSDSLSVVTL